MPLISDDTQTIQIRRTILNSIEEMDIEMLKRIAYECRCEEMGILPDNTYIRWWFYDAQNQRSQSDRWDL